ncbi:hypothetical protein AV530_013654 [Patagioenas fasciata monilis]|uniref:Jhy protein-like protein n=1 Tax=Patagioenas fasciata monilis TaxID=372326 RepID=A0A1V4J7B2_PATFA|nr:hypothetical protein AV530_013654 [Patagioenas fasciata monilis]
MDTGSHPGLVYMIGAKHGVNSSDTKYISVSSPHTCNLSKTGFPRRILTQPDFHPANWKRSSVREGGFTPSLRDSQDSDFESLVREREYQIQLQQRIRENEELVGLSPDEVENDSLEEDSLEEESSEEQEGAECDANQYTNEIQKNVGSGRKQQSVGKYLSLRYSPNWTNTKEATEFSEAEKSHQVAGGSSGDFSQDSFYLHSNSSPAEMYQQEARSQGSFSDFGTGTELQSFHEPDAVISSEPLSLHSNGKEPAAGRHFKHSPSTYGSAFSLQIPEDPPRRQKKDFVERNKRTLGLRSGKTDSYLQLHAKKEEEVLQEQDQQKKSSQRNKIKSKQSVAGRAFPRSDSQKPPGRAAEPKPWHHGHHQSSGFQPGPVQGVEPDNSSARWRCLCTSPSVCPDTNTAAHLDTRLNHFPSSRHVVNQDFTTSTHPFHPTLHTFNPVEVIYPAYTSKESKKYRHDSPNGLPRDQRHVHSPSPGQLFARDNSTNGQADPNQRNISSTFNANCQELVKNQVPLQDHKRQIYADKSHQNYAIGSLRSPTAPGATSPFTQPMERHPQEITHWTEAHLAARHSFSLLPPVIPHVESGLDIDPESGEGNQVEISRSNSEGYIMQMGKQNQPKVSKKPCSSKTYINLNVKLGGLGPDYEAIKEKKEKLRQQKEYAKQIKEHNKKSIASVQSLPAKPQVISSVSRQKALEYAKKIPRPKTFTARQSGEEVKEERVLPQTLNGASLPQIASLETLHNRHEQEKQVVAAFRTLHIL